MVWLVGGICLAVGFSIGFIFLALLINGRDIEREQWWLDYVNAIIAEQKALLGKGEK